MLEKHRKHLFTEGGEVNKEALVEFYKELRKFPDLSDSDAAILAATKWVVYCNLKSFSTAVLNWRVSKLFSIFICATGKFVLSEFLYCLYVVWLFFVW